MFRTFLASATVLSTIILALAFGVGCGYLVMKALFSALLTHKKDAAPALAKAAHVAGD